MVTEIKAVFAVTLNKLRSGHAVIVATNDDPELLVVVKADSKQWKLRGVAHALEQLAIGLLQWREDSVTVDARPTFRSRTALRETTRHRNFRRRR